MGGAVAWWQQKGESQEGKAKFGFGFSLKSFLSAALPDFDVRFSRVAAFAPSKAAGTSQRAADTEALCLALCFGTEEGLCFNLPLSWLLTKQLCCSRNGRLLGVCASVDNCRLFVGGIPKTKKREEILAEMKKVTDGVVDVIVYPSAADKTKNRGFAFVEYESHRAAAMARRKLLPGQQGWGGVASAQGSPRAVLTTSPGEPGIQGSERGCVFCPQRAVFCQRHPEPGASPHARV